MLMDALEIHGVRARVCARYGIPIGLGLLTLVLAVLQALLEMQFPGWTYLPALWIAIVWALWTYWHTISFPRARLQALRIEDRPYPKIFVRHVMVV